MLFRKYHIHKHFSLTLVLGEFKLLYKRKTILILVSKKYNAPCTVTHQALLELVFADTLRCISAEIQYHVPVFYISPTVPADFRGVVPRIFENLFVQKRRFPFTVDCKKT